ncbi:ParB/RepB/Spo0J family partition protein [Candidatus Methanoperedens nitratireducens]|uniref:ParB/Spo0J HTH domain-containing protein n=1 Tax=Candidatus Methanoperedens nitratireducens TaxID=1392998 RepID=A0A284VNK6_9EURY|nr:hypothetical protein [Candidatus Methanoperedens nitroreducens]SNQ60861.1 hypothetical protein MNV_2060003 [Candidatus Methanoperedens nitroreducens]
MEEAQGIKQVLDDGVITQTELAKKMGKSQAYVANRIRLLDAPQELKDLIISQEISPAHVQILLPFVGYPVFEDIMKELKGHFDAKREVSVVNLETQIIPRVFYQGKNVADLNGFSYDIRKLEEFFDKSQCVCTDRIKVRGYYDGSGKRDFCLNKDCFSVKLAAAQTAYDLAKEKEKEELVTKKIVDTDKLDYGMYRTLRPVDTPTDLQRWDQTPCSSCDSCKKGKDKSLVCLDVACYDKKEKAYNKEQNGLKKEESLKAWQICDERLKGVTGVDIKVLRSLLSKLANGMMGGSLDGAFTCWPGVEGEDEYDISKIPDEDIPKAFFRFILADRFEYSDPTVESMNKSLEELGV